MELVSSEVLPARMHRTLQDTPLERFPSSHRIVSIINNQFDRQLNAALVGQV